VPSQPLCSNYIVVGQAAIRPPLLKLGVGACPTSHAAQPSALPLLSTQTVSKGQMDPIPASSPVHLFHACFQPLQIYYTQPSKLLCPCPLTSLSTRAVSKAV
jgi:hypothetical protein